MEFEWDEEKRLANARKHGLDFLDASGIFDGPCLEVEDRRKQYQEDRSILYGTVNGLIVILVYTRRGDKIRCISFRRANSRERKRYEEAILD
jgi:uncharacterized DUF497 family protein